MRRAGAVLTGLLAAGCASKTKAPTLDASVVNVGPDGVGRSGVAGSDGMPGSGGAGGAGGGAAMDPRDAASSADGAAGALPGGRPSVFVHLFEWRWADVARECETFLGPRGFSAVQISPPSEHSVRADAGHPWWQRYQTVSYDLARSRSGTEAELRDMIDRCARAGVAIYADAVINHMTALASGVGSNGTAYTKYRYPGLFEAADFHAPPCGIEPADYVQNAAVVQRCELAGLADLDTAAPAVRDKIAGYLIALVRLGVRGLRIDAAKHIPAPDLDALVTQVDSAFEPAARPYYFLEVIDPGGEAVRAADYLTVGRALGSLVDITEFKYGIGSHFVGRGGQTLAQLRTLSPEAWQLLPGERAVVFTNNHDTQRADAVYYKDGPAHELANVFLLAWPYGQVAITSSYAFDRATLAGRDAGPPSSAAGVTTSLYASATAPTPACAPEAVTAAPGSWVCEHRQRTVANMVAFRKSSAGAPVASWWDNGGNQIAFARAGRGFVAINRETTPLARRFATGLPAGSYCDVLQGDFVTGPSPGSGACTGPSIEVGADGQALLTVPGNTATALHVGARVR